MKKIITLFMSIIFLVACGIDEARYEDYDIIDIHNPIDERAVLEHVMEEQRGLLKLGFITEFSDRNREFRLTSQSIIYDASVEELTLKTRYKHSESSATISFEAMKNPADDLYQQTIDQFGDATPLDHSELSGFYGSTELNDKTYYGFAAEGDNAVYVYRNTRAESEGFDAELAALIGMSLKTEKEGAHSQFYDRFTLEADQLQFPMLDEEHIENIDVRIHDHGDYEPGYTNWIQVGYNLSDGTSLTYGIDQINLLGQIDRTHAIDEDETENGLTVTEYIDVETSNPVFIWKIDDIYYSLEVDSEKDSLRTDDIHAIIDSSADDKRAFENKDLFTETNKEPTLTDIDRDVLGKLRKLEY